MGHLKHGGFVYLFMVLIAGCSTQPDKPLNPPIQRPLTPTMDSIQELFGILHVDEIVGEGIAVERAAIDINLQTQRSKRQYSPAQERVLDEFSRKALSVVDQYMSIDQVEGLLAVAIHDSFAQQDVGAMASFYRTRSGQAVVAKAPAAMRAFAKQWVAEREAGRNAKGNSGTEDSLPLSPSAFFKPWESPEYSQFFATDIGQDIKARWPAAAARFAEGFEKSMEPMQTRLRQISLEYQAKMNAAGTGENR